MDQRRRYRSVDPHRTAGRHERAAPRLPDFGDRVRSPPRHPGDQTVVMPDSARRGDEGGYWRTTHSRPQPPIAGLAGKGPSPCGVLPACYGLVGPTYVKAQAPVFAAGYHAPPQQSMLPASENPTLLAVAPPYSVICWNIMANGSHEASWGPR